MVEPISAAIAGGAVGGFVVKRAVDGLATILGPASEEVALALRRFTEVKLRNVGRVLDAAEQKVDRTQSGDSSVPLRVALRLMDEAAYADDEFVVEYLGGVLASARTPRGRDDRGNTFISLVSQLSTYHLRTHFIFYTELRRVLRGLDVSLGDLDDIHERGRVFVPDSTYLGAMDFSDGEDAGTISNHSLWWLSREDLLGWNPGGSVEYLSSVSHLRDYLFSEPGTVAWPTIPGTELYLWALGRGQQSVDTFLHLPADRDPVGGISIRPGSCRLDDLRTKAT